MSKIISINGGAQGGASLPPRNGSGHAEPHTSAPWIAVQGNEGEPERWLVVAGGEKQYHIAVIENGQPGDCCATEGATARLIAAAPELLVALKAIVTHGESIYPADWVQMKATGLAAIAKASGQNAPAGTDPAWIKMKPEIEANNPKVPTGSVPAGGSEMRWAEIHAFVKRLVQEPRGQRRAANLIREIASELAQAEACEDLANAATEVTRMLVLAWELRWDKTRDKSQNS